MNMRYPAIRPSLDTGDIVLFSGKGGISAGIKWFTTSRWSHVGMVLKLPDHDLIMLWESTTLSDLSNSVGVQLVPLSARLNTYGGEVAIRQLSIFLDGDERARLNALRRELTGRPYEANKLELVRAAYDGAFGANTEDLSSLFCSELVAEAYQNLGLLGEDKPSNEYTPADFSAGGGLTLLRGSLGPEINIAR